MTPTEQAADRVKALVDRLRSPLPICPYDPKSPDYYTAPDDKPCAVCGQINDINAPIVCRGADTRCMDQAADALTALQARAEDAERENERLSARNLEVSTLAHGWMVAHDNLAAGLPVTYPSPADVPASLFVCALMAAAAETTYRIGFRDAERVTDERHIDYLRGNTIAGITAAMQAPDADLTARVETLQARVGELEGALKPFAAFARDNTEAGYDYVASLSGGEGEGDRSQSQPCADGSLPVLTQASEPSAAYWFRYEDERGESDWDYIRPPKICLRKYRVISQTDKTVLLEKPGMDWSSIPPKPLTRRVLKDARKRFAYPTEELAMKSFRIRKRRQRQWIQSSLDHVEAVLALLADDQEAA